MIKHLSLRKAGCKTNLNIIKILELFTRDQLRQLARKHNIPRGENKHDTILNIYNSIDKLKNTTATIKLHIDDPRSKDHLEFA